MLWYLWKHLKKSRFINFLYQGSLNTQKHASRVQVTSEGQQMSIRKIYNGQTLYFSMQSPVTETFVPAINHLFNTCRDQIRSQCLLSVAHLLHHATLLPVLELDCLPLHSSSVSIQPLANFMNHSDTFCTSLKLGQQASCRWQWIATYVVHCAQKNLISARSS